MRVDREPAVTAKAAGGQVAAPCQERLSLFPHFGAASLKPDPAAYLEQDFSALIETVALAAGMKLTSENKPVKSGLETTE
jgi:3-hydroxyisobutyrate dehydrogenase